MHVCRERKIFSGCSNDKLIFILGAEPKKKNHKVRRRPPHKSIDPSYSNGRWGGWVCSESKHVHPPLGMLSTFHSFVSFVLLT